MATKLIVFEGIDNSGKTSISKGVIQLLQKSFPLDIWVWSKEPDFSTEEADRLNDPSLKNNEIDREILFLESRLRQLSKYLENNVVLDRYLWTGIAYAKVFSPKAFSFVSRLYQNENIFKIPDITVFVDTPVDVCQSREPSLTIERLFDIRNAYLDTEHLVKCRNPIIKTSGDKDLEGTILETYNRIMEVLKNEHR